MSPTPSQAESKDQALAERHEANSEIDFNSVASIIVRGKFQIIGLTILGMAIAALIYFAAYPLLPVSTTTRLIFAFNGLERGEYPDHSKFQPDDVRAPYIVQEALKLEGLDTGEEIESKIRGALSIEGIIPPSIVKERDRLRANGQTPPPYISDEYSVTLTLPGRFSLSTRQRELLLNEIIEVYLHNFQQTYADLPKDFGNAFETLRRADFYEYELILGQDLERITLYLEQQTIKSPSFRSPTTHLSFSDLLEQTHLFSQIRLNETLGLIYSKGLSADRATALMKMDYYLHTITDEESKALQEEAVIRDLLSQAQTRNQNYLLGIKEQVTDSRTQATVLDQGLIDSLLANDAYNFLVHRALDAGLKVKEIQSQKAQLLERRKNMDSFLSDASNDQTAARDQVNKSLADLESSYNDLVNRVRQTSADFSRQQFSNAVRYASQIKSDGIVKPLTICIAIGGILGMALGLGISLLRYFPNLQERV